MVLERWILEVRDAVGGHEVLERPRAQGLVDLTTHGASDRAQDRRESLNGGERAGRQRQDPHEPAPGVGIESGPNDVRDLGHEHAYGQGEQDREDSGRDGSGREQDDEASFGEPEE